jgi:hypothetical protein
LIAAGARKNGKINTLVVHGTRNYHVLSTAGLAQNEEPGRASREARRQRGSGPVSESKRLSSKQVQFRVGNRLRKFDNLKFLECFAMFMGKAQLVELSLKKILTIKYSYDENRIERWTLGTTIKELGKCGLRKDFITLLKDLNEHRIYIAHELLADDALMKKLAGSKAERFAWKSLERGLYAVETVIVVHDFLATNKYL